MIRNQATHTKHIKDALTLAIKNQDGKYDECLIERLLDCFQTGHKDLLDIAIQVISELNNDVEFKRSNNSRLYRLQKVYCLNKESRLDEELEGSWLQGVWSKIPTVLTRNDPSEIKSLIPLLTTIVERRSASKLLEMRFEPPIQSALITDILSLIRFFIIDNNNYHIENAVCDLFAAIILKSITRPKSEEYVSTVNLVQELILAGRPAMYYVIQKITTIYKSQLPKDISLDPLEARLAVAIKSRKELEVNTICKCLGKLMQQRDDIGCLIMEDLREARLLGPMLTFATHCMRPAVGYRPLLHIVLYTVLTRCKADCIDELVRRQLEISSADREFVEKNSADKHVLPCLEYIENAFHIGSTSNDESNEERLVFSILLQYIKSNYNESDKLFKNLMNSCTMLQQLVHHYKQEEPPETPKWEEKFNWISKQINPIFSDLIEPFRSSIPSGRKAFMLVLINTLEHIFMCLPSKQRYALNECHDTQFRLIQFASKVTDPDLLVELRYLVDSAVATLDLHAMDYINLMWTHMRGVAVEENHRELLSEVISTLIRIDFECEGDLLVEAGLTRFQTIPSFYNDILSDPAMDDDTIETISCTLCYEETYYASSEDPQPRDTYIAFVCKYSSDFCIKRMAEGLCKALSRDISRTSQLSMLSALETIIESSILDETSLEIERNIFNTLYRIHGDEEYHRDVRLKTCKLAQSANHQTLNLQADDDADATLLEFICDHRVKECFVEGEISEVHPQNRLALESYVDQILNQEGAVHLECY